MNTDKSEGGQRGHDVIKEPSVEFQFPMISVVTVVLNGAAHLEVAIKSVLDQDYPNLEYIVIDGGSSDGTLDIIKRYEQQIHIWLSEPDQGIYDAMNKGIALAAGELIGLLNGDDRYEPGALKAVAKASTTSPAAGIFYGNSYILQEDMGLRYRTYGHTRFWRGMGFPHQAMFVRRHVHTTIGTYDTAYRLAADYDFVLKALAGGIPLCYVDAFLVSYSNTGLSGSNLHATLDETRKISKKHFGLMSPAHMKFLILFAKSCTLMFLEKVIRLTCGERLLTWARVVYTKLVIASDWERI